MLLPCRVLFAGVVAMWMTAACEPADRPAGAGAGAGSAVRVIVPPPLRGEPPLGADREAMLQAFADNIGRNVYTHSNLVFLLCNTEAGKAAADLSGDPLGKALLRRMTALFRSAPGMSTATCAPPGSPQPGSPYPAP